MEQWLIGAVVGVISVYLAFKILAFLMVFPALLLEKRFIRFLSPASAEERSLISDYMEEVRPLAMAKGFRFINTYKPDKGPWRNILVDLWLSEDRRVLALVGTGYVIGAEYSRTAFYSILDNGTRMTTADNFDEGDPLGVENSLIRPGLAFDELYSLHVKRLDAATEGAEFFSEADPMAVLEEAERRHVQRLVDQGLAKYRDLTENCWSYTFRGACEVYYRANPEQIREYKDYEKTRLNHMAD